MCDFKKWHYLSSHGVYGPNGKAYIDTKMYIITNLFLDKCYEEKENGEMTKLRFINANIIPHF